MKRINIAKDYSRAPWGRYHPEDGPCTGQRFRDEFLRPNLEKGGVIVNIDGTEGYGSSFLSEAFGGLVFGGDFTEEELREKLVIEGTGARAELYKRLIWDNIAEAASLQPA